MSTSNTNNPDQLAYEQYQYDMTAYLVEAYGKKTDYETVLNAMIALWSKNDFNLDTHNQSETLVCTVHGWTLAEFLDTHCAFVEASA